MAEVWTNWAGEQRCAPEALERPRSSEEVVAAVERARDSGRRVRVAGSGHSFTDIACSEGTLLHLGAMDRVLDSDTVTGLVRVQAGITLHELGSELAERGLAMENQGDIDRQSLAGALATATHGTGLGFRNVSSQVAAMRIVTADGAVLDIEDEDTLRAARVGLGALGVVTEVTLRCVPIFTLRRVDEPRPLEEVLSSIDALAEGNDHFEFYVFPYTGAALVRETQRSKALEPDPPGAAKLWFEEVALPNIMVGVAGRAGRIRPGLIPPLNRALMRAIGRTVRVDRSARVYASRRDVKFTEMEYALPREHGEEAIRRVLDTIERRRLPVGFPLEFRLVAGDDSYLSTAHGHDTAYIAVHQFKGMEFEGYFRAVERIMDDYGGRPHWGKRHYQSAATLAPRYPEWDAFAAVRERLDPDGLFSNDYVDRVLGPVGAAVSSS
ncbi:MAG: D-arabinono-1,4-lactone oxidase [Thermoleophilaceae bacterium]